MSGLAQAHRRRSAARIRRLKKAFDLFYDIDHRTDIPKRTDQGTLPNYRTHKHQLFGKQEGRCAGCRVAFPFRNLTATRLPNGWVNEGNSHDGGRFPKTIRTRRLLGQQQPPAKRSRIAEATDAFT